MLSPSYFYCFALQKVQKLKTEISPKLKEYCDVWILKLMFVELLIICWDYTCCNFQRLKLSSIDYFQMDGKRSMLDMHSNLCQIPK